MSIPLNEPFFEGLKNRYAYFAHDDGWFGRLFCNNYEDFSVIIGSVIIDRVEKLTKMTTQMSEELKIKLLSLAEDGLLIDFKNIVCDVENLGIPIYVIGKYEDMDNLINNRDKNKDNAVYSAKLINSIIGWEIIY